MSQKGYVSLCFWWSFSVAANPAYEIPPHLYSPLKPTRTLIAKAIARKKGDTPRMPTITIVFERS